MGFIDHHAIVATSWHKERLARVHAAVVDVCGPLVSPIIEGVVNGYGSFLVAPEGSKSGWTDAEEWEKRRDRVAALLASEGSYIEWVEVAYGNDLESDEIGVTRGTPEDQDDEDPTRPPAETGEVR